MRIYFDNAATTPMLPEVIETMMQVMSDDFGNPSSIHHDGRKAKSIIENARKIVAKTINASISEVFFTSSATEAHNLVLKNAVEDLGVKRIISCSTEHHCMLHSFDYLQKKHNTQIIYLDIDQFGSIDYNQLSDVLAEPSVKTLVCLMHGNNEIGTMSDINKIGVICKEMNALFHCDTVQTMGKFKIDVQTSNISFLAGSAHKFHGPKGSGFVYINNENIIHPYIHGGAQERNMRAGTENVAGIAGLAKALELASENMDKRHHYILNLRHKFKSLLDTHLVNILYNGLQDDMFMPHVLSVSFPPSTKADMLVMNLDIAGISVSSGSACTAGIEEDSHVLQAIGHPSERKTIRFSFSYFNTEEELLLTIEKLRQMTASK